MIVEHAFSTIKPGQLKSLEAATREARPLITASSIPVTEMRPSAETNDRYALVVGCSNIAFHRDGLRISERYTK